MRSLPIVIVILLVLAASVPMDAESLSIHLDVGGGLDAQLDGLTFFATIDGNVALVGDFPCNDSMVWILATGSITGTGFYNILELITRGWVVMTAAGKTDEGEAVVFRSLLYASSQSSIPLRAGNLFEGVHHTVIQLGEFVSVYWGQFTGTLGGGLAPVETEGTIRLSGSGSFYLTGERVPETGPTDFPGTIPLDDPNLTDAFLQTLAAFFDLPIAQEPFSVANDP